MRSLNTLFASTLGVLTALSSAAMAQAQAPPTYPVPAPSAATAPSDGRLRTASTVAPAQPRPASSALPTPPRPSATAPPPVAGNSYWANSSPPAPKRKPSALRRFFGRFASNVDEHTREEGYKVVRDPATGRTNVLASKPWLEPRP